MSWSKLTPDELYLVRNTLHLSVAEAAEWVAGHTNPRTWQRYEAGTVNIPDDIDMEIYALTQHAEQLFSELHSKACLAEQASEVLKLPCYREYEAWIAEKGAKAPALWRVYQSVIARIFIEFGSSVELV